MRRPLMLLVLSLSFIGTAWSQSAMPPLVDREIFFGNPEVAGASLSPDGNYLMFRKPYKGTMNIWVKKVDEPFDNARLITNRTDRPIAGAFWSRDSKYILFTQDKGGDENFNVYAVDPTAANAANSDVPAARNLTDVKGARAQISHVPDSDPDTIYVLINDRDKAWHDVYRVKISTGERTLVIENKDRYSGVFFDNADKLRLAVRSSENGDYAILRIDQGGKASTIYSCDAFESCSPVRFHKDNKRLYMSTNKGDLDLIELVLLDVDTGKIERVEGDPEKKVDFGGALFSDLTDELEATIYEYDRERIYWKDKAFEKEFQWLKKQFGDKDINIGSPTKDETKFIVTANSDTEPGETFIWDRKAKKLIPQYKIRQRLDRATLSPMRHVTYKSSDGLEVPAFLTIPKGSSGKNLPTVMYIHGGPWGRDYWGYHSYAQFLANRGYAVLQPNFRASTGYGKKFLNAGNNEWGQKMQDDITWGVKYLVEQGIADPKRVGIMGGSYGGYAALAGVTFTPDLYAASVAIVPPSNLQTLLDSIPPYWEAIRATFYKRMGDPRTPEGLAQMKRQSPHAHADKIKTPLMVVQGANDPRVKQRESDQIVVALRDRNYPVEYLLAPDEGHGFARPLNNMAMVAAAEKFLAKHLGGRYQESMTPEVAKRLGEITVDGKTVVVKDPNAPSGGTGGPTPAVSALGKWSLSVDAGGQTVTLMLDLQEAASGLKGTLTSDLGGGKVTKGSAKGSDISLTVMADIQGQATELQIQGKIDGDKIGGVIVAPGFGTFTFAGARMR
jgi:dipeptidyl aminopeptidase/acylaminoacyl peptidase